ncbi:unnamed protein product [Klebsiella pneumoniae subsp. rhinoscleromatis SB3432]|nr:unnamed protein product [Klebsiella pneumoniae subsp. rhinoscleromatis SB3432]
MWGGPICSYFSEEPGDRKRWSPPPSIKLIRDLFPGLHQVFGELPTRVIVGDGRGFAARPNLMVSLRSMPNVFTGSCARMRCCLSENPLYRHRNGHIPAEWL